MSDLVAIAAVDPRFVELTPISKSLVDEREREELAVRFFTFIERAHVENGQVFLPEWRDRPREYIYDFVKDANTRGREDAGYIEGLRAEFDRMLAFVAANFPSGFRKTPTAKQVPRVRFEAIAVGAGLALRQRPALAQAGIDVSGWIYDDRFQEITSSDAANVRAKVQGRIGYVLNKLVAQ
jgi:hypothetical protein